MLGLMCRSDGAVLHSVADLSVMNTLRGNGVKSRLLVPFMFRVSVNP
jgi:hypothetical protein